MTPPVAGAKPYAEGKVFPWQRAYLNVGDEKMQMAVPNDGSAPVFTVSLPKGPAMLRAWFTDAVGRDVSAFYVVLNNDTAKTPAR